MGGPNNMDPPAVLVSSEAVRAMEAGLGCVSDATCSARQYRSCLSNGGWTGLMRTFNLPQSVKRTAHES